MKWLYSFLELCSSDLDCNDLKVCTELSHPVQNVIILENENIVTVNEKILVK